MYKVQPRSLWHATKKFTFSSIMVASRHHWLPFGWLTESRNAFRQGAAPVDTTKELALPCASLPIVRTQVNYLGHFQLTLALLPLLKASSPSRIVHVSSAAHRYAPQHRDWLKREYLNDAAAHSMVERYGMAKVTDAP